VTPAAPGRLPAALEAVATAVAGGALAGATWSMIGLGWPAAAIGVANGAISGARGTYGWRTLTGPLAFALDSTWALPMTAAGLAAHGVAATQGRRSGYLPRLSARANRHVYTRGLRMRRDFAITVGNVINGAGAVTSARRERLVTDHEDVHIWQARWFGPLYPVLYAGWTVVGGAVGAGVWLVRRRGERLTDVVEACGYYLNPFEWWAYSRDDRWPPPRKVAGLGWVRPIVRPLSEVGRRGPAPAGIPATPR
jgi:hypothetical protein